MAKGRKKKSEGLGDTVEKVLEATGISKVVKWVMGEDCGCDERKAKLNALFPYRKPECLQKHEFEYLEEWFSVARYSMKPTEQKQILNIYNRVFKDNVQQTNCGSCLRDILNNLEKLYIKYKEDADTNA